MSTLAARAEEILAQAKQLDTYIASSGLPHTSFAHDSLTELPAELERVRLDMVNSTQQLKRLAQGAVSSTVEMLYSVSARYELVFLAANQILNSSLMSRRSEQSTTSKFRKPYP